jgi:DNA (cytosine-5)-methyltransferase 3A
VDRKKARAILESDSRPNVKEKNMARRYFEVGFNTIVFKDNEAMLRVKEATRGGYTTIRPNQAVDLSYPTSETRRGRAMRNKLHTITEAHNEYYLFDGKDIRYFTQTELERCQTLPDGYTSCISRNKAAGCIGDGWTVDVIAHIFEGIKTGEIADNKYIKQHTLF